MNNYDAFVCRYHEIAIKGGNRNMFEKCLVDNIRHSIPLKNVEVSRTRGRMLVRKKDNSCFDEAETAVVRESLPRVFGLESFSPIIMCKPDISEIRRSLDRSFAPFFDRLFETRKKISFRIRARRSDKEFFLDSKQIEISLAHLIFEKYGESRLGVNLGEDADITVGCEVRHEYAFVFYESIKGPGGLPVGSNSPVLGLLSGGIDSPVACHMIMGRGCHADFLTFHSHPYTPMEYLDKVSAIRDVLNKYQRPGRLFACNLSELQKKVRDLCSEDLRTVIYRRMMFRIARKIALKNKIFALVTGESVGQVASQTITNLEVINAAAEMLVLRPLCGMSKNETIERAVKMGTFDLSSKQVPDSCTVFAPSSPSTRANLGRVLASEERLGDYDPVLEEAASACQIL